VYNNLSGRGSPVYDLIGLTGVESGAKSLRTTLLPEFYISEIEMNRLKFPQSSGIENYPGPLRALAGCLAACVATSITYWILPLRAFPLLLAFPTVILSAWFLGMWGGIGCALADAILVDIFLTRAQARFSFGNAASELRFGIFLTISILLGYTIRRLAEQRAYYHSQHLEQRLTLAHVQRELAEERAHAIELLRERDERLQIALQSAGMGLWVWDVTQNTLYWSDEMFRLLGHQPSDFAADTDRWMASVHPEDVDGVKQRVADTRSGGAGYRHDYRLLLPDGQLRWVESQTRTQLDGEGRVLRLVGVITDVTHRKLAEQAMLRNEKLAVVGRLASSVAHEINNPLEAVTNLLFLVSLSDSVEAAHEYANKAMDEVMRVSLITQQMLKFHRGAGVLKPTLLSELVTAVQGLFRGKLNASHVKMSILIEDESKVVCMPGETQQIIANLVSNAIEAMPKGGKLVVRLRPSTDWRDRRRHGMRVTFSDAGTGMDKKTMRHIFEPFFTTKTETGTGLGMWIVAQLLERQQGHIRGWSTQRPGRTGTAFSIFLPDAELMVERPAAIPALEQASA
jgi:PAS domain S-box-containing protein